MCGHRCAQVGPMINSVKCCLFNIISHLFFYILQNVELFRFSVGLSERPNAGLCFRTCAWATLHASLDPELGEDEWGVAPGGSGEQQRRPGGQTAHGWPEHGGGAFRPPRRAGAHRQPQLPLLCPANTLALQQDAAHRLQGTWPLGSVNYILWFNNIVQYEKLCMLFFSLSHCPFFNAHP